MAQAETILLYDGKVTMTFNPGRHYYRVNGKSIPGVTSITGFMNDGKCDALIGWAVNETLAYLDGQLKPGHALDEVELVELLGEAKKARNRTKDTATTIGKVAHGWVEGWVKYRMGQAPQPEAPINPHVKSAVDAFLAWEEEHEVGYVFSERRLVSLKHWFAGTADLVAYVDGQLSVIDLKTSNYLSSEHLLQTAAYLAGLQEEFEDQFENRWILHLHKDDAHLEQYNLNAMQGSTLQVSRWTTIRFNSYADDLDAFLGLRAAYKVVRGK